MFELELRCGTIETETREELSRQFDKRERDLERQHMERLIAAVSRLCEDSPLMVDDAERARLPFDSQNERSEVLKAKQIDIVQRSVRKPAPTRTTRFATPHESEEDEEEEDEDEDDEVDRSLVSFLSSTSRIVDSPLTSHSVPQIAGSQDSSFDTDASVSEPPSPSPATDDVETVMLGEPVKSVSRALQDLAVESSDAEETDEGDATETTVLYVEGESPASEEGDDVEGEEDEEEQVSLFCRPLEQLEDWTMTDIDRLILVRSGGLIRELRIRGGGGRRL